MLPLFLNFLWIAAAYDVRIKLRRTTRATLRVNFIAIAGDSPAIVAAIRIDHFRFLTATS
jgi:hypothetical protein